MNANLCVLRGRLAGTARRVAEKDGRYHTVRLSFTRKTEPFLRVVTPLTHVERTVFSPLKNPTAQLEQDYLTNTKQIHWMLRGTEVTGETRQAPHLLVSTKVWIKISGNAFAEARMRSVLAQTAVWNKTSELFIVSMDFFKSVSASWVLSAVFWDVFIQHYLMTLLIGDIFKNTP